MLAKLKTIILALIVSTITFLIILFPEQALAASLRGLKTWWEIVFPSLLPFFIVVELLVSFGVVQFVGVLFEPLMRPLFNVPGVGSFAWIGGMVSGFPSGAKITTLLREKNELSRIEAERLISFSNASSPLFIFGAIAVGFFHQVELGIIIASSHYISNFIVGLIMRFYKKNASRSDATKKIRFLEAVKLAFARMHATRIKETRPFGQVLGDAVLSSIQTLLIVGGFIILFSVFTTLLSMIELIDIIALLFAPIFKLLHIPPDVLPPLITGMFEITMGSDHVAKTDSLHIVWQLVLVSFILGFNGFSIQAQVASIIAKTDIRFKPYFYARIIHGCIAGLVTYLSYRLFFQHYLAAHETIATTPLNHNVFSLLSEKVATIGPKVTLISISIGILLLLKKRTTKTVI